MLKPGDSNIWTNPGDWSSNRCHGDVPNAETAITAASGSCALGPVSLG